VQANRALKTGADFYGLPLCSPAMNLTHLTIDSLLVTF